jgi:hypothetical protein
MACAFLAGGSAAPLAAFWRSLPEAETVSDPRGPKRSGGWQPGNYFASRCKAAPPQKNHRAERDKQKTRGGGGK